MQKAPVFKKFRNLSDLQDYNHANFKTYTQFIFENKKSSNDDIYQTSNSVAHFLLSLGLKSNAKVGFCAKLSPMAFAVLPGIWRAGLTAVSIHAKLAPIQVAEILDISRCDVLFIDKEKWDLVKSEFKNKTNARIVLITGTEKGLTSVSALEPANTAIKSTARAEDTSLILFSSGSTGRPKGIILTHGSMLAMVEQIFINRDSIGNLNYLSVMTERGNVLFNTPLGHVVGITALTLNMVSGSTYILQDVFEVEEMLRLIEKYKVYGYFFGPPTVFVALNAFQYASKFDLSSMKFWLSGGAPIGLDKIAEFKSKYPGEFVYGYGMTEASCYIAYTICDEHYEVNSVGKPFPYFEAQVVSETREVLPTGSAGELRLKGPAIGAGYLDLPEETHLAFSDGWLYTGDLAKLTAEGEIHILGRVKHLIRQAGVNVFPRTIELVLESIKEIKECAVVGMKDEVLGERVVAYVVPLTKEKFSIDHVRKICTDKLARYEVPRQFVIVDGLPRTSSNKIDIPSLMKGYGPAAPGVEDDEKFDLVETREKLFATMRRIAKKMGVENLADDSPLMQSGFDSLACVEFAVLLSEELKRKLSETLIFNYPTLQQIVDHLVSATEAAPKAPASAYKKPAVTEAPDDIAIIGVSCRLPGGATNVDELWNILKRQKDCLKEIPLDRWPAKQMLGIFPIQEGEVTQTRGGFIENLGHHDAQFFGLTPAEAKGMDPQARILQQMAWEAIESALIDPSELKGGTTGVFLGCSSYDYLSKVYENEKSRPEYGLGSPPGFLAGRLSSMFDLNGPSLVLDTTCSSSLAAIHLACNSIISGECDLALSGGVSIMLLPLFSQITSILGVLSPQGTCRTFDSSANGYVRSEGGGVILLKRLSQALSDENKIFGVIKGTALRHDGKSTNVGAPNGTSQIQLMSSAIQKSGLKADEVSYVEAHGTGTVLGDAIELNSIHNAYQGARQARKNPLFIGSVKTNIGHTEAAAGVSGLIKILSSMKYGHIPASLNYSSPNKNFDWETSRLQVADYIIPWQGKKVAGVNSFGLSGTIASAIISEPPAKAAKKSAHGKERTHHVLCLSAKSLNSLKMIAQKYIDQIDDNPHLDLASVCFTANTRRKHFPLRTALVFSGAPEMRRKLVEITKLTELRALKAKPNKIGFLFPGQGGAYSKMAKELYESSPTFKALIDERDPAVSARLMKSFADIISSAEESGVMRDIRYSQASLTAIQLALTEMFRQWGVEPTHVLGHSSGEFAAASSAKILDAKIALDLAVERSMLFSELPKTHEMAAIWLSPEKADQFRSANHLNFEIAAQNAPECLTIVCSSEQMKKNVAAFTRESLKIKVLENVAEGVGGHSPWVDPILSRFDSYCVKLSHQRPKLKYYSSVYGQALDNSKAIEAAYWTEMTRKRVRYSEALSSMIKDGVEFFVEIGPSSTLSSLGPMNNPSSGLTWVNCLQDDEPNWKTILTVLKGLYENGYEVNWKQVDQDYARNVVDIPIYQFDLHEYGTGSFGDNVKKVIITGEAHSPPPQAFQPVTVEVPAPSVTAPAAQVAEAKPSILAAVAKVLDVPEANISETSSLRDAHIDSLKMIQIVLEVEEKVGVKLDLAKLNFSPESTIQDLISEVQNAKGSTVISAGKAPLAEELDVWSPQRTRGAQFDYQLICLHHLGGSAALYNGWSKTLDSRIQVMPIQLPGRDERANEKMYTHIDQLMADLIPVLKKSISKPVALFGHSLGSVLAAKLAATLMEMGIAVDRLYVSGFRAPSVINGSSDWSLKITTDNIGQFVEIPPQLSGNREFLEKLLPKYEADQLYASSLIRSLGNFQINCPISAFAGDADRLVTPELVKAWKDHNPGQPFEFKMLKGSHMFVSDHHKEITEIINSRFLERAHFTTMKKPA